MRQPEMPQKIAGLTTACIASCQPHYGLHGFIVMLTTTLNTSMIHQPLAKAKRGPTSRRRDLGLSVYFIDPQRMRYAIHTSYISDLITRDASA